MQQIRDSLVDNPRLSEALVRECQHRFPDGPNADERDLLLVGALSNQGRLFRARMEAYAYFQRHPNGRYTSVVAALGGVASPEARH